MDSEWKYANTPMRKIGMLPPMLASINKWWEVDKEVDKHMAYKDVYPSRLSSLGLDTFTICFRVLWMLSKCAECQVELSQDIQHLIRHCMIYTTPFYTTAAEAIPFGEEFDTRIRFSEQPWCAFLSFQSFEPGRAMGSYNPKNAARPLKRLGFHKQVDCKYDFNEGKNIKIMPPSALLGENAVFNKPLGMTNNAVPFEKILFHPIIGSFLKGHADFADKEWNLLYKKKALKEGFIKIRLDEFLRRRV